MNRRSHCQELRRRQPSAAGNLVSRDSSLLQSLTSAGFESALCPPLLPLLFLASGNISVLNGVAISLQRRAMRKIQLATFAV